MKVNVTHGLADLAADCVAITKRVPNDLRKTVREGAKVGNVVARDLARISSRKHARLYPRSFSSEMRVHGLGGLYAAEYGPTTGGQGNLAPILENGSVNNPAHNNLARSADLMGPALLGETHRLTDEWFW